MSNSQPERPLPAEVERLRAAYDRSKTEWWRTKIGSEAGRQAYIKMQKARERWVSERSRLSTGGNGADERRGVSPEIL